MGDESALARRAPKALGDENDPVLVAIERAMIRIRRSQTRRTLARRAIGERGLVVDPAHLSVVDAVDAGAESPGQEVTVGVVAERLGIDPSRASRLVAATIRAGYVARVASQADGRRIRLELTKAGRAVVEAAHRDRRMFYDRLMEGWSEEERRQFALLMAKFTEALTNATRP